MVRRNGLILIMAILAVGGLFYWQNLRIRTAEDQTGLLSSRVLSAVFVAKSEIRVARLSGDIFAVSRGCSLNCWVANGQETRAPFSVDYSLSIKNLPISAFRWNDQDRIMSVDMPNISVDAPNIDMSRAKVKQSGAWVSRGSGIDMQRKAANYMVVGAGSIAKNARYIGQARENARKVVEAFVAAPLAAAGLDDVQVVVRLDGDAKPASLSNEQWDMSRPLAEVLADMK